MDHELIYYYLPGHPRMNSSTGKMMPAKELGPYVVSILGSYWREVTRAEVQAYVKRMHGVAPTRTEVHLNPIREL